MARWLNKPVSESKHFDDLADGIIAGIQQNLKTATCTPAAPACYIDGLGGAAAAHTGVHGAMYVAGCNLLPPADALELLPFLKAKSVPFPRHSVSAN
jgi:hypothetical protein